MATKPFSRYLVRGPSSRWWHQIASPFLNERGWFVIDPTSFAYEESYGFDKEVLRHNDEIRDFGYALRNSDAVIEYRGGPTHDSVFDPEQERSVVEDILAFSSLYSGTYCQYLWKEYSDSATPFKATSAMRLSFFSHDYEWAGSQHKATEHFEMALSIIPSVDWGQFGLAISWFFSAMREFEIGRPLVEAALNWVCLESQANYLDIAGSKFEKVQGLLKMQRFPTVPRLHDFYRLRNDAFHDGTLSSLAEEDAQSARTIGRSLVRAQILNLIGMPHAEFQQEFVALYAP